MNFLINTQYFWTLPDIFRYFPIFHDILRYNDIFKIFYDILRYSTTCDDEFNITSTKIRSLPRHIYVMYQHLSGSGYFMIFYDIFDIHRYTCQGGTFLYLYFLAKFCKKKLFFLSQYLLKSGTGTELSIFHANPILMKIN